VTQSPTKKDIFEIEESSITALQSLEKRFAAHKKMNIGLTLICPLIFEEA
jgi:hypothetical protein